MWKFHLDRLPKGFRDNLKESLPGILLYLTCVAVVMGLLTLLPSDYPGSALHFFHR